MYTFSIRVIWKNQGFSALASFPGLGLWTWLWWETAGRRNEEPRSSALWREAWIKWSTCSLPARNALWGTARARSGYRESPDVSSSVQHVLRTSGLVFWVVFFPATVQRYSDQPDQPRPGSEPDPLHPTGEKRRFQTEGVKRRPRIRRSVLESSLDGLLCSWLKVYPQVSDPGWLWEGNHGVWAGGVPPAEARGGRSPQAEAEGRRLGLQASGGRHPVLG